jgi:hypothetical protein
LKQAGLLANQFLQTRLAPFGYYPARHTPGLWLHKTWTISFTLVVDDFAVKYVGKQHADHLRNALLRTYKLTTSWTATVYSGMTLKWDYKNRTCNISMPGYVSNVLSKFQHDAPKHPQHTPSWYVTPLYGAKNQYATRDKTPQLKAQKYLTIQKRLGRVCSNLPDMHLRPASIEEANHQCLRANVLGDLERQHDGLCQHLSKRHVGPPL